MLFNCQQLPSKNYFWIYPTPYRLTLVFWELYCYNLWHLRVSKQITKRFTIMHVGECYIQWVRELFCDLWYIENHSARISMPTSHYGLKQENRISGPEPRSIVRSQALIELDQSHGIKAGVKATVLLCSWVVS